MEKRQHRGRLSQERKAMLLESAALAYVQMEHGDYRYGPGTQRGDKLPDGRYGINKSEVMRRAGYSRGRWDHFNDVLQDSEEFWSYVELYRVRYTDPMFRKESENLLIEAIGGEALRNLYEDIFYRPHSLTVDQKLKIAKFVLDAGISMVKLESKVSNKTERLLSTLDPEGRKKVVDARIKQLDKEREELERTMRAHQGADLSEMHVPDIGMGDSAKRREDS